MVFLNVRHRHDAITPHESLWKIRLPTCLTLFFVSGARNLDYLCYGCWKIFYGLEVFSNKILFVDGSRNHDHCLCRCWVYFMGLRSSGSRGPWSMDQGSMTIIFVDVRCILWFGSLQAQEVLCRWIKNPSLLSLWMWRCIVWFRDLQAQELSPRWEFRVWLRIIHAYYMLHVEAPTSWRQSQ